MAMWGTRYHAGYPNQIADGVRRHSPECRDMVLLTDRMRDGIDPAIRQEPIPAAFDRPEFYKGGYPVKLSVFRPPGVPDNTRCVFVDLDTLILGDLGRLAALITGHEDIRMLPPANVGCNPVSRALNRWTKGRKFRTGNSSLLAFSTGAERNLADAYLKYRAKGEAYKRITRTDDGFISWFAQARLRDIPDDIAVMLRREFLSKVPGVVAYRAASPLVARRRAGLAAVTLNGTEYKPGTLLTLSEGDIIRDSKGRRGVWGDAGFRPVFEALKDRAALVETGS